MKKYEFFINRRLSRDYIERLCKMKRFNIRTDKHIVDNKKDYENYMSHQPYEDCTILKIDKVIPLKIASLAY